LTSDHEAVRAALGDLRGDGPTAMRDAVWAALQLRPDDETRPLVLLFTDGIDNASWLSTSDTLTGARRTGVVIHAVELAGDIVTPSLGRLALPSRLAGPPPTFLELLVDAAVAGAGRRRPRGISVSCSLEPWTKCAPAISSRSIRQAPAAMAGTN
jgi:hypothetical protein